MLAGVSAGAICWFASGLTNSLGPGFSPVAGLGLVEGGFCPHADSDPGRAGAPCATCRPRAMPPTLAVDDGAAVHLADGAPPRSCRPCRAGAGGRSPPAEPRRSWRRWC